MANTSKSTNKKAYRQSREMLARGKQLQELFRTYENTFSRFEYQRKPSGTHERVQVSHDNPLKRAVTLREMLKLLRPQLEEFFKMHQERGEIGVVYAPLTAHRCVFICEDISIFHRLRPRMQTSLPISVYNARVEHPQLWIQSMRLGPISAGGTKEHYIQFDFVCRGDFERILAEREAQPFFNAQAFIEIPEGFHFGCNEFEQDDKLLIQT